MRVWLSLTLVAAVVGLALPTVTNHKSQIMNDDYHQNREELFPNSHFSTPNVTPNAPSVDHAPLTTQPSRLGSDEADNSQEPVSQLVQFKSDTNVKAVAKRLGTEAVTPVDATTYVIAKPTVVLETLPEVAHTEPNAIFTALTRPNDPNFGNQLGLANVSATNAWDLETGSPTVRIAVIDTGVNGLHEDLFGRVIEGYDFVNDHPISRNSDSDDNGHGTGIASVAAAQGNNRLGMTGLAWNVEVMPIKALNQTGSGTTREVMLGIRYAIERGANVILMSIGSTTPSTLLEQAINEAWDRGILTVAAAGNDGAVGANLLYPAQYNHVLSVGATFSTDVRAPFSNFGSALDVVAPGVDIMHATDDGGYATGSGTSYAAPFVAATASLLKSRHPGLTPDQLFHAIRDHTDTVAGMNGADWTDQYGSGRLNAAAALQSVTGDTAAQLVRHTEGIPPLGATQSWQIEYVYQNTGTSVWRQSGPHNVQLITAQPTARILPFVREDLVTHQPSGWVAPTSVRMVESEVRPGATGTFRFWISVPPGLASGNYDEPMQLEIRDQGLVDGTSAPFQVRVLSEADRYHTQLVGQSPQPTLAANGSARFQVLYRNVGNATWTKGIVKLGTSRDLDRVSSFLRQDRDLTVPSGWSSPTRVSLDQDVVAPGQIGSFTFSLADTPSIAPGVYHEFFRPVADGLTWLEGEVGWDLTVQ